jgi:hypothetical protein
MLTRPCICVAAWRMAAAVTLAAMLSMSATGCKRAQPPAATPAAPQARYSDADLQACLDMTIEHALARLQIKPSDVFVVHEPTRAARGIGAELPRGETITLYVLLRDAYNDERRDASKSPKFWGTHVSGIVYEHQGVSDVFGYVPVIELLPGPAGLGGGIPPGQ